MNRLALCALLGAVCFGAGCRAPGNDNVGDAQTVPAETPAEPARGDRPPGTATPADDPPLHDIAQTSTLAAPAAGDHEGVVGANSRFALDVYSQLAGQQGNLFFSPFSISSAVAMTWSGAGGITASEIAQTLHFQDTPAATGSAFAALNDTLAAPEAGYELRVANRLWGQSGYDFEAEFLAMGRDLYGAPMETVDFVGAAEAARERINTWVADETDDKIKGLIPPNTLDRLTRLVLTNAIYFKGTWARQFDPAATTEAPFHLSDGRTQTVPLMHQEANFGYSRQDGMQLLRLPYVGEHVSMIVLLPEASDDLAVLEASLDVDRLAAWIAGLREVAVQVYLPRFEMSSHFSLKEILFALGMETAFDPDRADFSRMTGRRELYISAAIHKAFVEVNEEGTEAAAATAVVMGIESVREVPVFRADHPFLFLIHDARTGSILFLGRLSNPQG